MDKVYFNSEEEAGEFLKDIHEVSYSKIGEWLINNCKRKGYIKQNPVDEAEKCMLEFCLDRYKYIFDHPGVRKKNDEWANKAIDVVLKQEKAIEYLKQQLKER